MEKLYLPTPDKFSFKSTLYSHGWADLRPFKLSENPLGLNYVVKTSQKNTHLLKISEIKNRKLEIIINENLNDHDKNKLPESG